MTLRLAKRYTQRYSGWWRRGRFALIYRAAQHALSLYYRDRSEELRRKIEVEQTAELWRQPHRIVPRLVDEVFGDGLQLIWLGPTNHRPWFYVVRIDSRWNLGNSEPNCIADKCLDDIKDAIEDQFGDVHFECELCGETELNLTDCPCQEERWFPAANFDSGCDWGEMQWPA